MAETSGTASHLEALVILETVVVDGQPYSPQRSAATQLVYPTAREGCLLNSTFKPGKDTGVDPYFTDVADSKSGAATLLAMLVRLVTTVFTPDPAVNRVALDSAGSTIDLARLALCPCCALMRGPNAP